MMEKLKSKIFLIVGILLALFGVGSIVLAQTGLSVAKIEEWAGKAYADRLPVPQLEVQAESDSIGGASGFDLPNPYVVGERVTYIATQNAADLTTTTFSITPPDTFQKVTTTGSSEVVLRTSGGVAWTAATTTVDFVGITVLTPATTTLVYSCGASTGAGVAPSKVLLTATVVTSSVGYFENNLTAALGGTVDGGTVAKIALNSTYPYFVCSVTEYVAGGVTNPLNTYTAKIQVRMNKLR